MIRFTGSNSYNSWCHTILKKMSASKRGKNNLIGYDFISQPMIVKRYRHFQCFIFLKSVCKYTYN